VLQQMDTTQERAGIFGQKINLWRSMKKIRRIINIVRHPILYKKFRKKKGFIY